MNSKTELLVSEGRKPTLAAIADDLNGGAWDALYYAAEEQVCALIDQGRISEDFFSRHQDYQEEARCLMADALREFA